MYSSSNIMTGHCMVHWSGQCGSVKTSDGQMTIAIEISIASVERLFSVSGWLMSERRYSVSVTSVGALLL